jgi:hypothetical protein
MLGLLTSLSRQPWGSKTNVVSAAIGRYEGSNTELLIRSTGHNAAAFVDAPPEIHPTTESSVLISFLFYANT